MAEWTADRQQLCFRRMYLQARKVEPGMGGRYVGDFHNIVANTARAQGKDPERLFCQHLETWLRKMPAKARTAPYAFFAQAWGELADQGPECVEEAHQKRPDPAARRSELLAQLSALEGDLAVVRGRGEASREAFIVERMEKVRAEMRRLKGD